MKIKNTNELWLKNSGKSDIKVADLNVKVGAGATVNVYKYNPYLTVSQVNDSRKSGSLSRKLSGKTLSVVQKHVNPVPVTLNHIKESNTPIVKKTKSSIVIEQENDDPEEVGSFEFADYGVADLGPVKQVSDKGSVVVQAKQDEKPEPVEDPKLSPEPGLSLQSQMIMQDMSDKQSSAYGKSATVTSGKEAYTVISPDLTPEVDPDTGTVTIRKAKEAKTSYLNKIKRAQESGADDSEEGADATIDLEATKFDTKVATKTEDGSVIMQIKEE